LLARGIDSPRRAAVMNDLTRLSAEERQQMIDDFVDAAFDGIDPDAQGAGIAQAMRSMPVQLPDDPTTEQVEAWIELAELVSDPAFRSRVREMATTGAASDPTEFPTDPNAVIEQAGAAAAAGVEPGTPAAEQVVAQLVPADLDGPGRAALADRLATFTDRRVERYWQLLGVLNGWPQRAPSVPAFEWLIAALRAGAR
jgi:hypothetical protein